jgi:cell wall-associated NlpC family hydrolase
MTVPVSRRAALAALSASYLKLAAPATARCDTRGRTQSPYRVVYHHDLDDLIGDSLHGIRGEPHRQSEVAHAEWYSHHVRHKYGAWGPPQRRYRPLANLADRSLRWRRERVVATAARFIGYGYQHHHVPDWNPPADWPWKPCCTGYNGRGVDCSNFTTFVYNQGFGIHMNSAIRTQAELRHAVEGHREIPIHRIDLPTGYIERQQALATGDLLYIRGREDGPITHVVIWVGSIGRSAEDVPLVLDSHGGDVEDFEGRPIPCGIYLRPFREHSWYNRCASHAHRVFV